MGLAVQPPDHFLITSCYCSHEQRYGVGLLANNQEEGFTSFTWSARHNQATSYHMGEKLSNDYVVKVVIR